VESYDFEGSYEPVISAGTDFMSGKISPGVNKLVKAGLLTISADGIGTTPLFKLIIQVCYCLDMLVSLLAAVAFGYVAGYCATVLGFARYVPTVVLQNGSLQSWGTFAGFVGGILATRFRPDIAGKLVEDTFNRIAAQTK
jgi:hypothetical protein